MRTKKGALHAKHTQKGSTQMLFEPRQPRFYPAVMLAITTAFMLCIWQGIIALGWKAAQVAFIMAWVCGWYAVAYTAVWLAWHASYMKYMFELLYLYRPGSTPLPLSVVPPVVPADPMVTLPGTGEKVSASALVEIDKRVQDGILPAQRSLTENSKNIRLTFDALEKADIISPAGNNTPATIRDLQRYEAAVETAWSKVGAR